MFHKRRDASRGAAIIETAIAVPLFVMSLFGVIWAFRTGALSEQVQQSVRYGGLVSALSNRYEQLSLYTTYATVDQGLPSHVRDCVTGSSSIVSQAHSAFVQPGSFPVQAPPICGLAIMFPASGVSYPVLLYSDFVQMSAIAQLSGVLGTFTFGKNVTSASQNFFRSPDFGVISADGHARPAKT